LPEFALDIADDGFGNAFILLLGDGRGQIVYLDQDSEAPLEQARLVANDFLDLLRRFKIENSDDGARPTSGASGVEHGVFSPSLETKLRALAPYYPDARRWPRRAARLLVQQTGEFSLHYEDASWSLLDLVFWVEDTWRGTTGLSLADVHETLWSDWRLRENTGFGLEGHEPEFVDDWWMLRHTGGILVNRGGVSSLSAEAAYAIIRAWQR
jgi:hypothetical protein